MSAPGQQYVSNIYSYGSDPITVTCFNCKNLVLTRTIYSSNPVCCFIFNVFALCYCQDVEHRCSKCNVILGTYKGSKTGI